MCGDKDGLFIWIDDFIDSGETLEICWQKTKDKFFDFEEAENWKFDWAITSYIYRYGHESSEKCAKNIIGSYYR